MIAPLLPDRSRSMPRLLTLLALILLTAAPAFGQVVRPDRSFYVLPRIGLSNYIGDLDSDFDLDEWDVGEKLPLFGGLEIGYQLTRRYSVALGAGAMNLPTTAGPDLPAGTPGFAAGRADFENETTLAYPFYLVGRIQGDARFAPMVRWGWAAPPRRIATCRAPSGQAWSGVRRSDWASIC